MKSFNRQKTCIVTAVDTITLRLKFQQIKINFFLATL